MINPEQPDGDGKPAPPAYRLAKEQGGCHGHRQRQHLKNRSDIGKRHMFQRGQKADGGTDFGQHADRHQPAVTRGQPDDQRTLLPGKQGDQRHRDDAAEENRLIDRHLDKQQLHQPVIGDEGQHAERHQSGALQIVITANHGGDGVPTWRESHARKCRSGQGARK